MNNRMVKKGFVSSLAGAVLFCSIFYMAVPFYFGLWNNEEEVPLVYKMTGIATYAGDPFVTSHTEDFTQVTPYLYAISTIARALDMNDVFPLFAVLHLLFMVLLYLSIRGCVRVSSRGGDIAAFAAVALLLVMIRLANPVPNGRWLFANYLDPEFVTLPFLFFTASSFAAGRYLSSYLFILVSAVLHPLYAVPVLFAVSVGLLYRWYRGFEPFMGMVKKGSMYVFMVIPYTAFLWFMSRGTVQSELDPSKILEFVRSPWHHKIPTLTSADPGTIYFYLFVTLLTAAAFFLSRKRPGSGSAADPGLPPGGAAGLFVSGLEPVAEHSEGEDTPSRFNNLMAVHIALVVLLGGVSVVSTFVRIPLLVQLSPYRISNVVVALTVVVFASTLVNAFKRNHVHFNRTARMAAVCIVIGMAVAGGVVFAKNHITLDRLLEKEVFSKEREMVEWVRENTGRGDLFINYSIVDFRTAAKRPVYFNFKSFPLTVDRQYAWYERLMNQYDIPENISPEEFKKVRDYSGVDIHSRNEAFNPVTGGDIDQYTINLERVLKGADLPVSYIAVPLKSVKHRFDPGRLEPVFTNRGYAVYRASRGSSK